MELTSVGEKNLEYFLPFLGDEVSPEWQVIGAVEDDAAIGAAAFELRDNMAIMKSIFVDEDYRRRGVASELLDAAKRAYSDVGIWNFLAYYDENEELTAFLNSEGFACAQSDPVYTYPILKALVSKKIGRILETGTDKNTFAYKDLLPEMKRKVPTFLEQRDISSSMIDRGSFDEELSFVYVKDGNIKGVLLARGAEPNVYLNLLITDGTDNLIAFRLLAALPMVIRENTNYDGDLVMAVANEQVRKNLESFLDEHLKIQTYSWSAMLQV